MSLFRKLFGKSPKVHKAPPATPPVFETHQNRIYPWIKVFFSGEEDPSNSNTPIQLTGDDALIKKDWLGDLVIFYVADTGDSFQILLERDLPITVTREELHQLAMDNLNRDIEFTLQDTNFGGHMLVAGGNHEAGALCLPGLWDWLAEHLDDSLIVGVPAKDMVILVPESEADQIVDLKIFVHEIFQNGERLLTRNIFRYDRESKNWSIVDRIN